ncbi:MAG: preprotein translocase subunit YajC [Ruminococcaceae bacterium]|nr:preprotein translocase subunit YajC [Oscillospiraceae bacterium]
MGGAGAGAEGAQQSGSFSMIIMMVVLFAAMYFFTIRPQKKQQKMEQELRENTQIGDEITTIGGICGRVVSVKDDTIVLETGSDRVKIKFKKYAIQTNHTANEKIQAEREAAKAAMQEKKEKKSKKNKDEE